jgi:hypothetical protein
MPQIKDEYDEDNQPYNDGNKSPVHELTRVERGNKQSAEMMQIIKA